MSSTSKIFFRSFVQPFYRENIGLFVFIFSIMFFIVSKVDGAGLYEYHYSLVRGMLNSYIFLFCVLFIWLIYVRKYALFVSNTILNPQHTFLHIYNQLTKTKRLQLFFVVQAWLLLPVLLYVLFILFVGLQQRLYTSLIIITISLLVMLFAGALYHSYTLNNLNKNRFVTRKKLNRKSFAPAFPMMLVEYVLRQQGILFTGIKIFTCSVLYLTARNNNAMDNDITVAFMFYNFGLFANGVLIFRIREFEQAYLNFYRSLPVPVIKRLLQYALIFFIFLIPECITAAVLTPHHLTPKGSIDLILNGFSLLLLMNSITFLSDFKMKDYIKTPLLLLCIEYIFLITAGITFLYVFFCIVAAFVFIKRYYTFEKIL